jgi:hypothetical protein
LTTYGNGLTVERFRIERQNGAIPDTICNFWGYVTVVHDNQLLETFTTDFVHGCRYQVAWIDKDVGYTFPENSIACEYFYVDTSTLTSGQPCAHIHS